MKHHPASSSKRGETANEGTARKPTSKKKGTDGEKRKQAHKRKIYFAPTKWGKRRFSEIPKLVEREVFQEGGTGALHLPELPKYSLQAPTLQEGL
eukprot:XP_027311158.1 uncharacterized protein LOC113843351 isoform X2 [Anas platyrhynchos]